MSKKYISQKLKSNDGFFKLFPMSRHRVWYKNVKNAPCQISSHLHGVLNSPPKIGKIGIIKNDKFHHFIGTCIIVSVTW